MKEATFLQIFCLVLALLISPDALANGPEISASVDAQLKVSKIKFSTEPSNPRTGQEATLTVSVQREDGHPVHAAWVELLIRRQGDVSLGELIKCSEQDGGRYKAKFRFEDSGTYDVEVSGNYVPLANYMVEVR